MRIGASSGSEPGVINGTAEATPSQSLEQGQSIDAKVLRNQNGTVVLKTESGQILKAKLDGETNLVPGDRVKLVVTEKTPETLALSIVPSEGEPSALPQRALPIDKSLAAYAAKLSQLGLPANSSNAQAMRDMMAANPKMSMDEAAFLAANKIPAGTALAEAAKTLISGGAVIDKFVGEMISLLAAASEAESQTGGGTGSPKGGLAMQEGEASLPRNPNGTPVAADSANRNLDGLLAKISSLVRNLSAAPVNTGTVPVNAVTLPVNSTAVPVNVVTFQGDPVAALGNAVAVPEGSAVSIQGNVVGTQSNLGTAAANVVTIPVENAAVAAGNISAATNNAASAPINAVTTLLEHIGITPVNMSATPENHGAASVNSAAPGNAAALASAGVVQGNTEGNSVTAGQDIGGLLETALSAGRVRGAEDAPLTQWIAGIMESSNAEAGAKSSGAKQVILEFLSRIPEFSGTPLRALEKFADTLINVARQTAEAGGDGADKLSALLDGLFKKLPPPGEKGGDVLRRAREELFVRLSLFEEALSRSNMPGKEAMLAKTQELAEHTRLLNRLDQFVYMQIPIKLGEDRKTAELYVYKKKSGSKIIDPDNVSILLALDLEHMGHLESFVRIRGREVSLQTEVEAEEAKAFFSDNIRPLHELLAEIKFKLADAKVSCSKEQTTPLTALMSLLEHDKRTKAGIDYTV